LVWFKNSDLRSKSGNVTAYMVWDTPLILLVPVLVTCHMECHRTR
jgi:hypothetical protein